MTPIEQTALTLVCMIASYVFGKKSGLRKGIEYIFSFMTDKEIENVVVKIEKDGRLR